MSEKVLPTLLIALVAGCSAIVNPSGAPFDQDARVVPSDAATDSFTPPIDSSVDSGVDSGPIDSSVDSGPIDSGPMDSGAGCPGGCDDGLSCTVDRCDSASGCINTPNDGLCDDGVSCTVDRCSASDDCINTPNDGLCDDGFCFTGARCDPGAGGCAGGGLARDCRDGDPCTSDTCDPAAMMCVNDPRDDDGDGSAVDRIFGGGGSRDCGGTDCDDSNPDVHPGATEICNGRDDNCDGSTDEGCPTPPDDCGSAQLITLSAGHGTASAAFSALSDDYGTSCGGSGGRDAVYYVDVSSLSDITVDTLGSSSDTVLAVTTDCATLSDARANVCDDDIDLGTNRASRLWLHRVGPRPATPSLRVFILVDGYDGGATGAYRVNVSVGGAHADACASPIDITGGGTLAGRINVSTGGFGLRGSCQDAASFADAEAIANFTGSSSGTASFTAFSRDFTPDLYVRSVCSLDGTELDCAAGSSVGGGLSRAQLSLDVTSGSGYTLFVDGATTAGGYSVDYQP